MSASLRTTDTEARYQKDRALKRTKPLGQVKPLMSWRYWKVIPNKYPHDRIYKEHHLLIPVREFPTIHDMNRTEMAELWMILDELAGSYDSVKWNFPSKITVPGHFHFHLGVYK